MRVALVFYEPAHSGQAVHVLSLAKELDRRRWEPLVCYPAGDERTAGRLAELGVEGHPWPMRRFANPAPAAALARLVRHAGIDLVHVHGQFAGLWARPAAWLAGAAVVYTPHTIELRQRRLRGPYAAAERLLGRLTTRIIAVCEADRRAMIARRWAPTERVVTVHNGIDWARWEGPQEDRAAARRRLGWPVGAPAVLQVGRLDAQKAPDVLLDAAQIVLEELPPARFYLAGDGPLRPAAEAQVRARGLAERVLLLGRRDDVPALMAAADVVALSSRWEGLPYTLIEAAAAGRPAVSTAVNGSPEVVIDGETGRVVPADDAPALARALLALLREPAEARAMGERARRWAHGAFDASDMARGVAAVYAQAVTERRR